MKCVKLMSALFIGVSSLLAANIQHLVEPYISQPVFFTYDLEIYWDIRETTSSTEGSVLVDEEHNSFRFISGDSRWVSDGITVWQYGKENNQVVIQDYMDFDPALHPSNILKQFTDYEFKRSDERRGFKYIWTAENDSASGDKEYDRVVIYSNADDTAVKKIVLTDRDKNISTYTLGEIEVRTDITAEDFSFTVPEGVDVIDNR
ncbi:MAG: LolA family protein [Fibrobacterota bacterium]